MNFSFLKSFEPSNGPELFSYFFLFWLWTKAKKMVNNIPMCQIRLRIMMAIFKVKLFGSIWIKNKMLRKSIVMFRIYLNLFVFHFFCLFFSVDRNVSRKIKKIWTFSFRFGKLRIFVFTIPNDNSSFSKQKYKKERNSKVKVLVYFYFFCSHSRSVCSHTIWKMYRYFSFSVFVW